MRGNVLQRDNFLNPPALGRSHLEISLHPHFNFRTSCGSTACRQKSCRNHDCVTGPAGKKIWIHHQKQNAKTRGRAHAPRSFCTLAMVKQDETQYVIRKEVQSTEFRYVDMMLMTMMMVAAKVVVGGSKR